LEKELLSLVIQELDLTFVKWIDEMKQRTGMKKVIVGCERLVVTGLHFRAFLKIRELNLLQLILIVSRKARNLMITVLKRVI